ncbi:MAG: cyclic pyranopterin monophosphate synthase MoaC [Bacillota bacterium]
MTTNNLTHVDSAGAANMVDVAAKEDSARSATACGELHINQAAWQLIRENNIKKGDVLAAARIAGIMAAKKTSELIPLCHQINLSSVKINIDTSKTNIVVIEAIASCQGQTGVEMEALTAVTVAALTVYDMIKAVDKTTVIGNIRLMAKSGGKSGDYVRCGK